MKQAALSPDMMGDLTEINAGGSHAQNPNGGVKIAPNARAQQGETLNNGYVFSDNMILKKEDVERLGLSKAMIGKTYSHASKQLNKKYTRKNDEFEDRAKQQQLDKLRASQDEKLAALAPQNLQAPGQGNPMMQEAPDLAMMGGMPQPGGEKQMVLGGVAGAMALAPIVGEGVNIARTLNKMPEELAQDKFNTNMQFNPNLINRDQIKTDIRGQEATAAYGIKNASGGNAGAYMANRVALNAGAGANLAQANLQSDMADSQELARVEGQNYDQAVRNKAAELNVQNINDANIAQYESMVQDSMANISQSVAGVGTTGIRAAIAGYDLDSIFGIGDKAAEEVATPSVNYTPEETPFDYSPKGAAKAADIMMADETAPEPVSNSTPDLTVSGLANPTANQQDSYMDKIPTRVLQNIVGTSPDGDWGTNSKDALITFQKKHGLQPTGTLDYETFQMVKQYIPQGL